MLYDQKGVKIEEDYYRSTGKEINKRLFTTDTLNHSRQDFLYDMNEKLQSKRSVSDSKFDSQGNWLSEVSEHLFYNTENVVFFVEKINIKRTIEYY